MNKIVRTIVSTAIAAAVPAAYAGISGGGNSSAVQQVQLLLVGPVDAVNARAGIVTVLGQKVAYSGAATLAPGDAAAVYGFAQPNGSFVATSIADEGQYVPGATVIYLSGKVTKSDSAVGRVVVGGLTVDLTGAMSTDIATPSVGAELHVTGTQPTFGGLVVANGISGGGGTASLGISGGGDSSLGISGGGTKSLGISGGGTSSLGISGGGNS